MKRLLIAVSMFVVFGAVIALSGQLNSSKEEGYTVSQTAEGYAGSVNVDVTFSDGLISNVSITHDGETKDIGTKAIDELPAKIIEANSANVDTISGATVTSQAIINATNQAIELASGTVTGTADGYNGLVTVDVKLNYGAIEDITVAHEGETEGIGTKAIDELPAKIVEANSTTVDVIASATITSNAILTAVNNALGE